MLDKIVIANRGEIACRIMRTAKSMGIASVAVYSDADAKALHTRTADEAVHIGPSPAAESYLVGEKIIAAAKETGAEAAARGQPQRKRKKRHSQKQRQPSTGWAAAKTVRGNGSGKTKKDVQAGLAGSRSSHLHGSGSSRASRRSWPTLMA